MKKKLYLSIPELARQLGISRIALYKKVKSGEIKATRIGRNFAIPVDYIQKHIVELQDVPLDPQEQLTTERIARHISAEFGLILTKLGKE